MIIVNNVPKGASLETPKTSNCDNCEQRPPLSLECAKIGRNGKFLNTNVQIFACLEAKFLLI